MKIESLLGQFYARDKAFESRYRLVIMYVLVAHGPQEFSALRLLLGMSDGNLATHLKYLERLSYLNVHKSFVERRPQTQYTPTETGRRALRIHLQFHQALAASLEQSSSAPSDQVLP